MDIGKIHGQNQVSSRPATVFIDTHTFKLCMLDLPECSMLFLLEVQSALIRNLILKLMSMGLKWYLFLTSLLHLGYEAHD